MPTIIVGSVVALILIAIVVNEIYKKKTGKITSPCGKNCGACGLCKKQEEKAQSEKSE